MPTVDETSTWILIALIAGVLFEIVTIAIVWRGNAKDIEENGEHK